MIFDQSSYPIFDVEGPHALSFMQWLCANDVDVGTGHLVYTQWLNDQGGIEADVTVLRLDDSAFRVTSACATWRKDLLWLTRQSAEFDVTVSHRTDLAMVGLMGPCAGSILRGTLDIPFDDILFMDR